MPFQFWGLLPQVFSLWRSSYIAFLSYRAVTSSFFGVEGSYDAFFSFEDVTSTSFGVKDCYDAFPVLEL